MLEEEKRDEPCGRNADTWRFPDLIADTRATCEASSSTFAMDYSGHIRILVILVLELETMFSD